MKSYYTLYVQTSLFFQLTMIDDHTNEHQKDKDLIHEGDNWLRFRIYELPI